MKTKKATATLDNWVIKINVDGGLLEGNIYDHETVKDGKFITSSFIVSWNEDPLTVETESCIYTLKDIHPDFAGLMRRSRLTTEEMLIASVESKR